MLSEVTQTQKDDHGMYSLIRVYRVGLLEFCHGYNDHHECQFFLNISITFWGYCQGQEDINSRKMQTWSHSAQENYPIPHTAALEKEPSLRFSGLSIDDKHWTQTIHHKTENELGFSCCSFTRQFKTKKRCWVCKCTWVRGKVDMWNRFLQCFQVSCGRWS